MAEIGMRNMNYGTTKIKYTIVYSSRKTLGITVHPDGDVEVKAPMGVTIEKVEEKIRKRAAWILKQQNYFKSFGIKIPQRRYVSGESHYYLGKQYILHVMEGKTNSVRFKGRSFEIVCKPQKNVEIRTVAAKLMKDWYKERAKVKFADFAEPIIQRFKKFNVEPTGLYIQTMENRWGSCTPKGKIILNTALIKALKPCIEYVITHELCHLLYRNHTKEFFELLSNEMPDWERWKNRLENSCEQIMCK